MNNIYFDEEIKGKISTLIKDASSLQIVMYSTTYSELEQLLNSTIKNVSIILDANQNYNYYFPSEENRFNNREILAKLMLRYKIRFLKVQRKQNDIIKNEPALHDKFCIVDGRIAILGSCNWSYNGFTRNKENIIVTDDTNIVDKLNKRFEELYNNTIEHNYAKYTNMCYFCNQRLYYSYTAFHSVVHDVRRCNCGDFYEIIQKTTYNEQQIQSLRYKVLYEPATLLVLPKHIEAVDILIPYTDHSERWHQWFRGAYANNLNYNQE